MSDKEFNLLYEPWIRGIDDDCNNCELSMLELFERAHEYKDLCGELPTQDIAVLRLLLAVLHTVFSRYDLDGKESKLKDADDALDRWEALWEKGRFPIEPIQAYLQSQEDRFWLFHPERPFYQCNAAKIGTEYTAAKLNGNLSESNNKVRLFPSVSGKDKNYLSFSEAARWLLYVNAYDDTSAKPSSEAKKSSEKLPSPGVGWLGKLGLLTIEGNNLFETLLLNLVMLNANEELYHDEHPIWERETVPSNERNEIALPDNLSELYTLQSRRLLLKSADNVVSGYYLLGGDFFEKENAFIEPMTIWSRQKSKTEEIYSPRRHDASKQFWREFSAVVPEFGDNHKQPGIISWIDILEDEKLIDENYRFKVKIASVQYGDKDFFVVNVFSDSISLCSALLSNLNREWQEMIINRIEFCDEVAGYVWKLAEQVDLSVGGDKESSKNAASRAKEQFYQLIDEPFRQWLHRVNPNGDDAVSVSKEWTEQCTAIARRLGQKIILQTDSRTIFGRNGASAADAINKFMGCLKKAAQL